MTERPSATIATRNVDAEVRRMQTVGHLRRTARDVAFALTGVADETAEVVALQNSFERALTNFVDASKSPAQALGYVAPDQTRAALTMASDAARANSVLLIEAPES